VDAELEAERDRMQGELIEELATYFDQEESARNLATNAGFPDADLPAFKTGRGFWTLVVKALRGGKTEGGFPALGREAARQYEHNAVFCALAGAGSAKGAEANSPPTVADPGWSDEEREPIDPFPGLKGPRLDSRELPQLVVIGKREGARVHWSYCTELDTQPFATRNVAWDEALDSGGLALRDRGGEELLRRGVRLGRLLLGERGEDAYHTAARTVFRAPGNEQTTPFAGGVRCRLVLDESLEEGDTPEGAIEVLARDRGWPRRPFLYWLDWHAQLGGIDVGVLEAWLRLATRQLLQLVRGLDRIRVVSTLGAVPGNPQRFRELSATLARDLQSDQTSITVFDPLGLITPEHLMRYLRDPRITGCPESLVGHQDFVWA